MAESGEEAAAILLQQAKEEMECFATGTFHCFSFVDGTLPAAPARSKAKTPDASMGAHQQEQRLKGFIPSSETTQSDTAAATVPKPGSQRQRQQRQQEEEEEEEEEKEEEVEIAVQVHPIGAEQEESDGLLSASSACATHTSFTRRPLTIGGILDLVRGRRSTRHYISVPTTTTTASVCPTMAPQPQREEQVQRRHRRLMSSTVALTGEVKFVHCDTPSCSILPSYSILSEPWIAAPIDAAFVVCAECGGVTVARASNTRYRKEELACCSEAQEEGGQGGVALAWCVRRIWDRMGTCLG